MSEQTIRNGIRFKGFIPKSRVVTRYGGHVHVWHSIDCKTGQNAKRSKVTRLLPDDQQAVEYYKNRYTDQRLSKCCYGKLPPEKTQSAKFTRRQAKSLFDAARIAGLAAGNEARPVPMVVGTPTTLLGNDIDYSKTTYDVPEGACGFAWVNISPGNSSIARHAKALGVASRAYGGGVDVWISDHGQSIERKEKHAKAFASVLQDAGIKAYASSRLD